MQEVYRKLIRCICLSGVTGLVAVSGCARVSPADLTGRWTLHMDPDFRGNPATVDCGVRQEANQVFVTCGKGEEMKGDVRGRTLTFRTRVAPSGSQASFVANIGPDSATLHGTWHVSLTGASKRGKFAARKQSGGPAGD